MQSREEASQVGRLPDRKPAEALVRGGDGGVANERGGEDALASAAHAKGDGGVREALRRLSWWVGAWEQARQEALGEVATRLEGGG